MHSAAGARHRKPALALMFLGSLSGIFLVNQWFTYFSAQDITLSSGDLLQPDIFYDLEPELGTARAVLDLPPSAARAGRDTLVKELEDLLLLTPEVVEDDLKRWLGTSSNSGSGPGVLSYNLEGWQILRLFQHLYLQQISGASHSCFCHYKEHCRPGLRPFYTLSMADTDVLKLLGALHCLLQLFAEPIVELKDEDRSLPPSLPAYVDSTGDNVPAGYFIAANLHNSTAMIPNFIYQLVQLVARVPDAGHVYISIYESSSRDSTSAWLKLLGLVLNGMGVQHNMVVNGNLTLAMFGGRRIPMLAALRNAALQPLLEYASCNQDSSSCRLKFLPTSILFVNDVFFTSEDAVRLLMHRQHHKADMACGMDFFYVAADNECTFYDIWVARDMFGKRFNNHSPFVTNTSIHASRLMAGWAIPVSCCWNGMVALNPEPFIVNGLRFRAQSSPSECYASECSYLCDDMHRLGYHDMLVDSGVRIAYSYNQTKDVQQGGICAQSMIRRPWEQVADRWGFELEESMASSVLSKQNAGPAKAFNKWHVPLTTHCCDGRADERVIDFNNCTDHKLITA